MVRRHHYKRRQINSPKKAASVFIKPVVSDFVSSSRLVEIFGNGKPRVIYKNITQDKIIEAIQGYIEGNYNKEWILGQIRDPRSLLDDDIDNPMENVTPLEGIPFLEDLPFYNKQVKVVTRNCGYIDPDSIEEYIAKQGYSAFFYALNELSPQKIIKIVKESDCGAAAAAVSQPVSNGQPAPNKKAQNISFAMRTRQSRGLCR